MRKPLFAAIMLIASGLACVRSQPEYVVITATAVLEASQVPEAFSAPTSIGVVSEPTLDPTRPASVFAVNREYVVQPGDTLSAIAQAQGVTLQTLLEANELIDPNILSVGQVVRLPEPPTQQTSAFKIIPDSRLVRGPGSNSFDVDAFIRQQQGYVRIATDEVNGDILSAAQIVKRVSLEYSVDPRLLLALLEYRSGWLTNPEPTEDTKTYPLGAGASPLGFDRNGLYRQLTWAADQLNRGYYNWKYGNLTTVEFESGERLGFAPGLNAGTIAVQHMLSQFNTYANWSRQIMTDGLYATYVAYFGDPFVNTVDPLVPPGIQQPELTLPFPQGEIWFFTGGPHGGWGSGSAWSAVDFAPPDDLTNVTTSCYLSEYWVIAVAPGIITRSEDGTVVLDLDGDHDETTGWSILYLHIDSTGRIAVGTQVAVGDRIGRASCEGGVSNGTHVHIARRYNGEWLPADCGTCPPDQSRPAFVMSGWQVVGLVGQEYQGYLLKDGEQRIAEQGRLTPENLISW